MTTERVDIIIRGAGLSGISLLLALIEQGYTGKVVIVEKLSKPETQKTWCFWGEQNVSPSIRNLINNRWLTWSFSDDSHVYHHKATSKEHAYCCLKAESFYRYAFEKLESVPTIEWLWNTDCELVNGVDISQKSGVELVIKNRRISAPLGFDSGGHIRKPMRNTINQYFAGAWVRTSSRSFTAGDAALMKNMNADENCFEFTYVLPFDANNALIELTRFSMREESLAEMQSTCAQMVNGGDYGNDVVIETWEKGVLPMDTRLASVSVGNWKPIGVRGNMIRASSGYAFLTIQRWAKKAAHSICNDNSLTLIKPIAPIYSSLDAVFLKVMRKNMTLSPTLFKSMAENVNADVFARFMTETASFSDMLSIIRAMPKVPFVKALFTPEH